MHFRLGHELSVLPSANRINAEVVSRGGDGRVAAMVA